MAIGKFVKKYLAEENMTYREYLLAHRETEQLYEHYNINRQTVSVRAILHSCGMKSDIVIKQYENITPDDYIEEYVRARLEPDQVSAAVAGIRQLVFTEVLEMIETEGYCAACPSPGNVTCANCDDTDRLAMIIRMIRKMREAEEANS